MGIVFPARNNTPAHKTCAVAKPPVSQVRTLKPLTLRNRIFLSSIGVFSKK